MKTDRYFFYRGLYISIFVISILWIIKGTELLLDIDLRTLGIYPRTLRGSIGIIASPFIHDDLYHLFSNSFPLLFLSISISYFYRHIALRLMSILYLGTGMLVWLAGREAFHIGASGLIYAMIGFLLFSGIFRREPQSMAISLAFLFLYGGVLQGVFPNAVKSSVSWESHLLGVVVGGICVFYFRKKVDPEQLIDDPLDQDETPHQDATNFTGDADYRYVYKDED